MANEKKVVTTGATKTAEIKKEKKVIIKRSAEDLKKTQKGRINITIRKAMEVANLNDRIGLNAIDKKDEGKDKKGTKQLAGRMNGLLRNEGKIDTMDEKSDSYAKLRDLATKALPELQKKPAQYGANTKAFLNFCLNSLSTEKGPRVINSTVLEGMTI